MGLVMPDRARSTPLAFFARRDLSAGPTRHFTGTPRELEEVIAERP